MTCQDPSKCGTGITKGQKLALTYVYSTGVAATTAMWQTYKSDASEAGIDIYLVGQTFNTIIGEARRARRCPSKCAIQVFAYGGWAFNGPGFEPTGEPLFATGAGSNSGNYSDPTGQSDHRHAHQQCHVDVCRLRHVRGAAAAVHLGAGQLPDRGGQLHAAQRHVQPLFTQSPSTGTSPSSRGALRVWPRLTAGPRFVIWMIAVAGAESKPINQITEASLANCVVVKISCAWDFAAWAAARSRPTTCRPARSPT